MLTLLQCAGLRRAIAALASAKSLAEPGTAAQAGARVVPQQADPPEAEKIRIFRAD